MFKDHRCPKVIYLKDAKGSILQSITVNGKKVTVDTNPLDAGMYFYEVTDINSPKRYGN